MSLKPRSECIVRTSWNMTMLTVLTEILTEKCFSYGNYVDSNEETGILITALALYIKYERKKYNINFM